MRWNTSRKAAGVPGSFGSLRYAAKWAKALAEATRIPFFVWQSDQVIVAKIVCRSGRKKRKAVAVPINELQPQTPRLLVDRAGRTSSGRVRAADENPIRSDLIN
jgi:hypothetical protein